MRACCGVTSVVNINDVLDGHVGSTWRASTGCISTPMRPNMQVGPQVNQFCRHLGQSITSPVVIEKIGNRFRREVDAFARDARIPVLRLAKPDRSRWDDRKLDHVRPYLDAAERDPPLRGGGDRGRPGVPVGLHRHQEDHAGRGGLVRLEQDRAAGQLFLLLHPDREFGPGSSRSAPTARIRPRSGSTGTSGPSARPAEPGSASPSWPTGSPRALDPSGSRPSATVSARRYPGLLRPLDRPIPTPFTPADRAAGYWWELSMRQVEVSRTLVFDDPRRARGFFESLVADNIGVGRPDEVRPCSAWTAKADRPSIPIRPGCSSRAPR